MANLKLPTTYHFVNHTGNKYGRLTVIKYAGKNSRRRTQWLCLCNCGTKKIIQTSNLVAGNTRSCGCLSLEEKIKNNTTHGLSGSPEYRSWEAMRHRCLNRKSNIFHNYGGRGITICDRWLNSFENFIEDMGKKPSLNHSIDRINVEGNYEPSNCRWSTPKEQANNKRKRPKMNRVESAIQSAIIHWVKEDHPEVIITATANERSYKETRQIGCLGITDLLLFTRKGQVLWLELKKKKGKLLDSQKDFNAMFDAHFTASNYTRDVAYGYEEAQTIIKKWLICNLN